MSNIDQPAAVGAIEACMHESFRIETEQNETGQNLMQAAIRLVEVTKKEARRLSTARMDWVAVTTDDRREGLRVIFGHFDIPLPELSDADNALLDAMRKVLERNPYNDELNNDDHTVAWRLAFWLGSLRRIG